LYRYAGRKEVARMLAERRETRAQKSQERAKDDDFYGIEHQLTGGSGLGGFQRTPSRGGDRGGGGGGGGGGGSGAQAGATAGGGTVAAAAAPRTPLTAAAPLESYGLAAQLSPGGLGDGEQYNDDAAGNTAGRVAARAAPALGAAAAEEEARAFRGKCMRGIQDVLMVSRGLEERLRQGCIR
jgi:hypothetical protein